MAERKTKLSVFSLVKKYWLICVKCDFKSRLKDRKKYGYVNTYPVCIE